MKYKTTITGIKPNLSENELKRLADDIWEANEEVPEFFASIGKDNLQAMHAGIAKLLSFARQLRPDMNVRDENEILGLFLHRRSTGQL